MLINKGYSANDVFTLKLQNGEEVIARYVSETDEEFTVSKPVALMMGQGGVQMLPMCLTMDKDAFEKVTIKKVHVIIHGKTDSEAGKEYITATTGIAVATA